MLFIHNSFMTHLLLFYRVIFYTFGFSLLGLTIYKYYKTRNAIVGSFLFLWSAMTATAAVYVITYYYMIHFNVDRSFIGFKIQGGTVCLIGVALPFFVHTIFKIKQTIILKIALVMASVISIAFFIPLKQTVFEVLVKAGMSFITLSNIYSFIVSFKSILKLNKDDKKLGLLFMYSFIVFFALLYFIDINSTFINRTGDFLFFPLFYIWIGGFCTFIGFKKLDLNSIKSTKSLEDFISKYNLTKREAEIALLLADGLTYKKIAEKLFISQGTVSTHVMHIYEKTETSSKIQLNKEISKFK